MECCKDCKHSFKRSPFSYKKYGSYGFPYECLKKEITYKRAMDKCEKYEQKESEDK